MGGKLLREQIHGNGLLGRVQDVKDGDTAEEKNGLMRTRMMVLNSVVIFFFVIKVRDTHCKNRRCV